MNLSHTALEAELPLLEMSPSTAGAGIGAEPMLLSDAADTADRELDAAIRELGRASERAMADGDPAGARIYSDRMMAAIRSRSPEHQARLQAETDRRVDDELTFAGDWTQQIARRRIG